MSHAVTALVLIHLDAHQGEWCALNWLAGRLLMPIHKLRPVCEQLFDGGQIQKVTVGDIECYGVRVDGTAPSTAALMEGTR